MPKACWKLTQLYSLNVCLSVLLGGICVQRHKLVCFGCQLQWSRIITSHYSITKSFRSCKGGIDNGLTSCGLHEYYFTEIASCLLCESIYMCNMTCRPTMAIAWLYSDGFNTVPTIPVRYSQGSPFPGAAIPSIRYFRITTTTTARRQRILP